MKLSDRLTARSGMHYVPGLQALVRFPLEQVRRDREAGLRIGTFISGYPGSPLAGYDLALNRIPDVLGEHDVTFLPAGNEELAMTSGTARAPASTARAMRSSTATSPAPRSTEPS